MIKELFLKSEDNIKVAVNHYQKEGRDNVLIICPGWFMCKDAKAFKTMSEIFFEYSDIITMDFRGHGKSSGFFTFSAKEINDLKAVADYAKKYYTHVSIMGYSLGGATAILYTAKYKGIDKLIAVSAPADYNKIENRMYKKAAYWPTIKKFELWRALSIRPGNMFMKKERPIDHIQDIYPTPVLFLAGEKDPTVYPWHAKALYDKANEPKYLQIFKNAYHAEDLFLDYKDKFVSTIIEKLFT